MVTSKITYGSYHSGFLLPAMIKHSENDFCHLTMPQKIYEYSLPPPRSLATRYKTRYPHQIQGLPSWLIAELWCGKTSSYHASRDAGLALFRYVCLFRAIEIKITRYVRLFRTMEIKTYDLTCDFETKKKTQTTNYKTHFVVTPQTV
jgi:hypothetical protein